MHPRLLLLFKATGSLLMLCGAVLAWFTWRDLQPLPGNLSVSGYEPARPQWLDRHGEPLSHTYVNEWNVHEQAPLHEIPALMAEAFVAAEDKRFFQHSGADWQARLHALFQNVAAGRSVRGASTITEQVVRMLHPRPRTLWSRWVEGFEARVLETRVTKNDILEFYLNQVPYASRRRGVLQASRFYFDRDLDTLNVREMLTLAVIVRSPGRLSPAGGGHSLQESVIRLAVKLRDQGRLSEEQYEVVRNHGAWDLRQPEAPVEAAHFIRHVQNLVEQSLSVPHSHNQDLSIGPRAGDTDQGPPDQKGCIRTTLDASLQRSAQQILQTRLNDLRSRSVRNGAVVVVDHQSDEVVSWATARVGETEDKKKDDSWLDAATVPRQPGSTLKPFLYAMALQKGWTAATLIEDSPLAEPIRTGLHVFQNYSRTHYGLLRLRDALGNSLNIPAVRTVQFVGVEPFLARLHQLGFSSLQESGDHYGSGLALGNGEVTLLELTRSYSVLARGGTFHPLRFTLDGRIESKAMHQVFSEEVASLVAHILSDPEARRLEFGAANVFRFPEQTAVKTGTSNDHRDAWALGFNHRFTVGVWMGNLDGIPTEGVTGTTGPGLVLRAVFTELNRNDDGSPLSLSRKLERRLVCRKSGLLAAQPCPEIEELFLPGTAPTRQCVLHKTGVDTSGAVHAVSRAQAINGQSDAPILLLQPTHGLNLALDPRIPDALEFFAFRISDHPGIARADWWVDDTPVGTTGPEKCRYLWRPTQGAHKVRAAVWLQGGEAPVMTPEIDFLVR